MKKILLLLLPFLIFAQEFDLKVIIKGVEIGKGNVMVGLFGKQKGFPDQQSAITGKEVKGDAASIEVLFEDLPQGTYAIAVFQDTTHTGKMQTDILGFPSVPFGFSTNANSELGPPTFNNAKFNLRSNRTIEVTLYSIVGDELKKGTEIIK